MKKTLILAGLLVAGVAQADINTTCQFVQTQNVATGHMDVAHGTPTNLNAVGNSATWGSSQYTLVKSKVAGPNGSTMDQYVNADRSYALSIFYHYNDNGQIKTMLTVGGREFTHIGICQ